MLVFEVMPAVSRLAGNCAGVVDHEVGLAEARQLLAASGRISMCA